ncbi:MAG: homocysteine S-methyltransferase family protein [Actinomycetota bacterium]
MTRRQSLPSTPITVIDGGMGKELARMGAPFRQPEWSAAALIDDPGAVRQAHSNFVAAGAQLIIANTYAVVPFHIGEERFAARAGELADLAGRLAREVAEAAAHPVRVAASAPPVFGSYAPERFDPELAGPMWDVLIEAQIPWADLWIVETIASLAEAEGAVAALDRARVEGERWLAFSLADEPADHDPSIPPTLWSGEPVQAAARAAVDAGADAVLINCAQPEAITRALAEVGAAIDLERPGAPAIGAYANGFPPKPEVYSPNSVILGRRDDLTPEGYADHADRWVELGATIVGGCCGIHPEQIAELARRYSADGADPSSTDGSTGAEPIRPGAGSGAEG